MSFKEQKWYLVYKDNEKFIHAIEGIMIIILLIGLWAMYFSTRGIQEEIRDNCGWGEEDYECYCKKSDAIALKNELLNNGISFNISDDVKLAG